MILSSANDLKNISETNSQGLFNIKLRSILEIAEENKIDANYSGTLPPIGMGSITLVDQIVLLVLIKLIKPKKVIEIGTFKGYTTKLFLENSTNDCRVFSIDLPDNKIIDLNATDLSLAEKDDQYNDNYLRLIQMKEGVVHLNKLSKNHLNRLKLIKADSTSLNFVDQFNEANLIFIDGGHTNETILKDTLNSEKIIKNGVIIWHDFNSNIHYQVTEFLKSKSKNTMIFHVMNSLCAFSFYGLNFCSFND